MYKITKRLKTNNQIQNLVKEKKKKEEKKRVGREKRRERKKEKEKKKKAFAATTGSTINSLQAHGKLTLTYVFPGDPVLPTSTSIPLVVA